MDPVTKRSLLADSLFSDSASFLFLLQLTVRSVPSSNRWQEISARRMEIIQNLIEKKLQNRADYIFCLDVDSKFHGRWGAESLGGLVAVIHPGLFSRAATKPYNNEFVVDVSARSKAPHTHPSIPTSVNISREPPALASTSQRNKVWLWVSMVTAGQMSRLWSRPAFRVRG